MINIDKLKKVFKDTVSITEYPGAYILNTNLVYFGEESETFAISIVDGGDKIVLTDIGETVKRLEEQDIDIHDSEVSVYVNKVLHHLGVALGPSNELLVYASNETDCALAAGRLYQAIILLSYIDLQYEYED